MDLISAYLEYLRVNGFERSSIELRASILHRLDRTLPYGLDRTTTTELQEWLYQPGRSQNTRATYYSAVKSAYEFWCDPNDLWLDHNPAGGIAPVHFARGVARPVEDEQLTEILARAVEPFRTWATIAAYQGLRCVELSRMDREHVTEQKLIVPRGKGGRARQHDTDALVWAALKDLPPGPVVTDRYGRRTTPGYISKRASHYFQQIMGLDGVTMHRFRHWLGVHAQAAFKDIRVTQEMLGHVSITSTQIYTAATLDQQRSARAMLPRPSAA